MITQEFHPDISDQEIEQALNTKEGEEYPKELFRQKIAIETRARRNRKTALILISPLTIGMGLSLIINVFKPGVLRMIDVGDRLCGGAFYLIGVAILFALMHSAKKGPLGLNDVVRTFYSGLGIVAPQNFSKSYLILAPNAMKNTPLDEFKDIWKRVDNEIISAIKFQDSVTCAHCGKESNGLWAVNKWYFADSYMKSAKLFVRCPDCNSIYCAECYVSFPKRHQCPKCGKKMKEIGLAMSRQGLETFMQDPTVKKTGRIHNIRLDQQNERVADLVCEAVIAFKYEAIVKSDSLAAPSAYDLGEKGKVVCKFHNKAVKIGQDWRLLSAVPGKASSC